MRNVAEILHDNIERYPDFIHKYIKTLAKFVKTKREDGFLNMEDDSVTYPILEEMRKIIKEKSDDKGKIIENYIDKLCRTMPNHVRRKKFDYTDPFSEAFYEQYHKKPSNGSEKLKLKMEKMYVSKLTSDLIIGFKNNYEKERNIFNKY